MSLKTNYQKIFKDGWLYDPDYDIPYSKQGWHIGGEGRQWYVHPPRSHPARDSYQGRFPEVFSSLKAAKSDVERQLSVSLDINQ